MYRLLHFLFFASVVCLPMHAIGQFLMQPVSVVADNQTMHTTIVNPQNILVPVKMGGTGFGAVNQLMFQLELDPDLLSFEGISPAAIDNVSANYINGMISLNWSNPNNPVNCTSTTILFYLQFNRLNTGDASIVFQPGSFVGNAQGLLPVHYVDGIVLQTYELELQASPAGAGILNGAGTFLPGQAVTVGAFPADGYSFVSWTINDEIISTSAVFVYTMPQANVLLQANFTPNTYQLTVQSNPVQGGTVQGGGAYQFGQNVNVNAIASIGYAFTHWVKDGQVVSTSPNYQFTMPAENVDLWAVFEQLSFPVEIEVSPAEAGQATGNGMYVYNESVTVVALENEGFHFTVWQSNGNTVSTNPTYSFNMPPEAVNLTARFALNVYQIELLVNNPDAGFVEGGGSFYHNTPVTITATANEFYTFVAWTAFGEVVSYDAIYSFPALQSIQLTAVFQLDQACIVPAALSVSDLGENQAVLHWVSPENIDSWDLLWGRMGTDTLVSSNQVEGLSLPVLQIDTLSPQTSYGFYVRARCDEVGVSDWSELYVFSTHYVGLNNKIQYEKLSLYPNPASESVRVQLKCENPANTNVSVFDAHGKQLQAEWTCTADYISIQLSAIPAGMYAVSVLQNSKLFVARLMIFR